MICFWAYQAFSQLLVYWMADLPSEVGYYQIRTTGSWWIVTYLLVFGHFVVPFFALINRNCKRHTKYLALAGGWMLVMHFVDVYWLVIPAYDAVSARPHWLDVAAFLFFAGLSSAWMANRYARVAPLPLHDPQLVAALKYEASA
jgi:hypothetical protein